MSTESIDWESVRVGAEALREICEATNVAMNSYKGARLPNSQASKEELSVVDPGARFLNNAFIHGSYSLGVAADHGFALYLTLQPEHGLSFAPWGCARQILETTSTCIWLLDPGIDATERTARGAIAELHDLDSARRYFRRVGDNQMVSKYDADAKSLLQRAGMIGIEGRVRKARQMNLSKRVELVFGSAVDYSMLSPVAHGNPRISLALGARPEAGTPPHMVTGLSGVGAQWLVVLPKDWIGHSLRNQYQLFGWNSAELESVS